MSTDLSLRIVVGASDAASSVVNNIAGNIVGSLSGINPALGGVAAGLIAIVGGAITVGTTATKMAADYQQAMDMVQALTGSSDAQMAQYDTSLKNLAVTAGVAPTELAKGLFNVLSAGYTGAQAMQVLTLATQDSKIGMTDAATATTALTRVLAGFRWETQNTSQVNGIMLETVTLGNATFQEYASTISRASTAASQYHVSLETMSAAWATMTANGIKAAQASIDFSQLTTTMYAKINTVTASLHKNGIAFDETKFNAMSYGDKVVYLNQALQEAAKKHVTVTGVTVQAAQAITKISQNMGMYNNDLAKLSDKQKMANQTGQEWAITQAGFNETMDRAKAALGVLMITIGQALLPVITKLMAQVAPIISAFAEWLVKSGALKELSKALSDGIAGLTSFLGQLWTIVKPLLLSFGEWIVKNHVLQNILLGLQLAIKFIGAAILFLLPYVVQIIQGLAKFAAEIAARLMPTILALVGFMRAHWSEISAILQGAWNFIVGVIKYAWALISGIFKIFIDLLTGNWSQMWLDFQDMLSGAWDGLKQMFSGGIQAVLGLLSLMWDHIRDTFMQSWHTSVQQPLADLWKNITDFFGGWPATAAQWGINLIVGFANGITSAIGNVTGAVQNVMSKITGFLGFHSPAKEGEGQHLLEWPRNMVRSYADELAAQTPYLTSKVSMLIAPLAMMSHAVPLASSTTAGGGGNVTVGDIHVHLEDSSGSAHQHGVAVATATKAELAKVLRQQGSAPRFTSGGH